MKNKIIKRIVLCVFILMFYVFINKVQANSIENIEMDINLDKNGNALVTETWQVDLTQGTEGYRTFSKLENSTISNFSVTDESGRKYQTISDWDTNESFAYKAYKCGIKETSDGVELGWGISQYGNKIYTLTYKINKLVTQYTDCQGIYFNFLNLEQEVNNVIIKIHYNSNELSGDNCRIWAYGYTGTINFKDGNIVLDSKGKLSKSQYMVGLIKFENNIFSTNNKSNLSFEKVKKSAEKGNKDNIMTILIVIMVILSNPITLVVIFFIIMLPKTKEKTIVKRMSSIEEPLNIEQTSRYLPSDDKIEYYREIPCNKDLEVAYWVCYQYYISANSVLNRGIIGAIFLKWYREGKITINKNQKKGISVKDNNYSIDFRKIEYVENDVENSLLMILKDAAGKNGILEPNEFKKWCKVNYKNIRNWFDNILNYTERKFEREGLIIKESVDGKIVRNVDPQFREEAINLKGLRRFLLDYSLMSEKEFVEVQMWEEYLIFAELLGIADKVQEQFSKLYPKFQSNSILDIEDTTNYLDNIINSGFEGIREAEAIEREKMIRQNNPLFNDYRNNSGGFGGSSSSSGGGSAGGSSGGGFR